jgi:DNA-binding MarR family transcriptional regulator
MINKKSKVKYIKIDLKMDGLTINEKLVYSHIKSLCDGIRPYCFASNKSLADTFGMSQRTLYRILNDLEKKNLIKRETKSIGNYGKERRIFVPLSQT